MDDAVDVLLLDQERRLADVARFQRERLLGPQPLVGEQADEHRVGGLHLRAQRLHLLGRERDDRELAPRRRLAHQLDSVACVHRHPLPHDRLAEDGLEHRHGFADRLRTDAVRLEVLAQPSDHCRRYLPQLKVPDAPERMAVPQGRVRSTRRRGEVRLRVAFPPLGDEVAQRLSAPIEVGERTAPSRKPDVRKEVERLVDRVELFKLPPAGGWVGPPHPEAPDLLPARRLPQPQLDSRRRLRLRWLGVRHGCSLPSSP